jgi:thioredoxin-like negative regulator of GroEL
VIAEISEPIAQSVAQKSAIEALVKVGNFKQAQIFAAKVRLEDKAGVQIGLAEALAEAGKFAEAQNLAAELTYEYSRGEVQDSITRALVKAGKLTEAQNLAMQISDPHFGAEAQAAVAREFAKTGQLAQATNMIANTNATIGKISDLHERSKLLSDLVECLIEVGQFDEAQNVTLQISDAELRSAALVYLAEALAKAGKFWQARTLAAQLGASDAVEVYVALITRFYSKPEQATGKNARPDVGWPLI